jgi:hypothetical protein
MLESYGQQTGLCYDILVDDWGPIYLAKNAKVAVGGSGGYVFERTNHVPRIWE